MCIVDFIVGIASPKRWWMATASSGISLTKSARQYHCSPFGYRPSKALCSIGWGIGATPCISGSGTASISGAIAAVASCSAPT